LLDLMRTEEHQHSEHAIGISHSSH